MLTQKDLSKLYETVLRSPGMGDGVKVSLQVSRRNVWLLTQMAERGLNSPDAGQALPTEWLEGLETLLSELLKKADLVAFSESLKELMAGKASN